MYNWITLLCTWNTVSQYASTKYIYYEKNFYWSIVVFAGEHGSISGLRRSSSEGIGYPLQYSCLKNPHGQRSLAGYSLWGHRVRHNWVMKHSTGYLLFSVVLVSITQKSESATHTHTATQSATHIAESATYMPSILDFLPI